MRHPTLAISEGDYLLMETDVGDWRGNWRILIGKLVVVRHLGDQGLDHTIVGFGLDPATNEPKLDPFGAILKPFRPDQPVSLLAPKKLPGCIGVRTRNIEPGTPEDSRLKDAKTTVSSPSDAVSSSSGPGAPPSDPGAPPSDPGAPPSDPGALGIADVVYYCIYKITFKFKW